MQVVIVDYGMGNLRSVAKAVEFLGHECKVTGDRRQVERAESIILPGVGSFPKAMENLKRQGLVEAILEHILKGRPFLGICLGLQLLFEWSEEGGGAKGLGVLKGRVVRLSVPLRVPHMGWNELHIKRPDCPLLKGVSEGDRVYFVHSFYAAPEDEEVVAATTDYEIEFPAAVWHENVFATQFHPEKSSRVGLTILKNFLEA
ncbi:MAG TPA: imidazole glycerol phosphate synthase subunit HisH [Armatimonadetes bacterium]|nr:imidazole glycerol phosphate synthase subunit HisH [Armatimonadota bacterium]